MCCSFVEIYVACNIMTVCSKNSVVYIHFIGEQDFHFLLSPLFSFFSCMLSIEGEGAGEG